MQSRSSHIFDGWLGIGPEDGGQTVKGVSERKLLIPVWDQLSAQLISESTSLEIATIIKAASPGGRSWLQQLPVSLATHMTNNTFCVSLALRMSGRSSSICYLSSPVMMVSTAWSAVCAVNSILQPDTMRSNSLTRQFCRASLALASLSNHSSRRARQIVPTSESSAQLLWMAS